MMKMMIEKKLEKYKKMSLFKSQLFCDKKGEKNVCLIFAYCVVFFMLVSSKYVTFIKSLTISP